MPLLVECAGERYRHARLFGDCHLSPDFLDCGDLRFWGSLFSESNVLTHEHDSTSIDMIN